MTKKSKAESQTKTASFIIENRETGSRRVSMKFHGQGRTRQDQKDQTDLNKIVERWKRTGELPRVNQQQPLFADFTSPLDYQDQLDRIILAQDAFDALPPEVRILADNDPGIFLEMMDSEEGRDTLAKAGVEIAEGDPKGSNPEDSGESPENPPGGSPPQKPSDEG